MKGPVQVDYVALTCWPTPRPRRSLPLLGVREQNVKMRWTPAARTRARLLERTLYAPEPRAMPEDGIGPDKPEHHRSARRWRRERVSYAGVIVVERPPSRSTARQVCIGVRREVGGASGEGPALRRRVVSPSPTRARPAARRPQSSATSARQPSPTKNCAAARSNRPPGSASGREGSRRALPHRLRGVRACCRPRRRRERIHLAIPSRPPGRCVLDLTLGSPGFGPNPRARGPRRHGPWW